MTQTLDRTPSSHDDPAGDSAGDGLELSVVMPCLNEERTVGICVEKAVRTMNTLGIRGEVVVVDNGSSDRSIEIAEGAGARVVRHHLRGYGNALRRGFDEARGRFIIMGDADDSYDFTDLARFVERLRGGAELVMGNRLKGKILPGAMPWHHRWIGNPILSGFLNFIFHTGAGDCHCGLRGFSKDAYRRMNLRMPGMELASEIVIKSAKAGLKIEEIPVTLSPDGRDRPPHLRSFRDGWRHLRFILMCSPLYLFALPGLLLMLVGLAAIPAVALAGYGVFDNIFGPNFMYSASLSAIAGAHILVFGFLAKLYTHQVDPVFVDPRVARWRERFSVEKGILCGLALVLGGVLLGIPVLAHWFRTTEIPSPAQWIFAGTLVVIGMEIIFASFLVGIMELPSEQNRQG
jgi:glycosyltransferase involved in cell wall biosynthesis